MRKKYVSEKGIFHRNKTYEGKSIEQQIAERMEGENIELGGKSLLYTERKDGVLPETNIRTDRMDLAMMAYDTVTKTHRAKRDGVGKKSDNAGEATTDTKSTAGDA